MSRLACRLAEIGEDLERASVMRRHRAGCLRCQARAARDHRVQRMLRTIDVATEPAPDGFVAGVMAVLPDQAGATRRARIGALARTAATGGAVIAAAAGATAVVAWRRGHLPV